jgi:hypothetical protein
MVMPEINANKLPEWSGAVSGALQPGQRLIQYLQHLCSVATKSCFARIMDILHKLQRWKMLIDVQKKAAFQSRMHNLNVIFVTFDYNYRIWEIMG